MTDAYCEEFKNRQSPLWWYAKASELHASAAVIWHFGVANEVPDSTKKELGFPASFSIAVGCWPVFPLLCGLAIETLLKGIIALSGKKHFGHDLVVLAGNAQLKLDEPLKKTLRFLSQEVNWAGRYPTPKKEDDLRDHWLEHSDIDWSWDNHRKVWDRFAKEFFARSKAA